MPAEHTKVTSTKQCVCLLLLIYVNLKREFEMLIHLPGKSSGLGGVRQPQNPRLGGLKWQCISFKKNSLRHWNLTPLVRIGNSPKLAD